MYLFLFVLCQNVMYYSTALSVVFDRNRALQVFIIIIIIKYLRSLRSRLGHLTQQVAFAAANLL